MVDEIRYVSLREILSRVTRHPLLQDLDLEAAIQYATDFFGIVGMPQMYQDKLACVDIHNYKGCLPCDVVRIEQVRDERTKACLRSMTDNFNTKSRPIPAGPTFRTNNTVIHTSIKEGKLLISYKAMMVDEDEIPMLPENSTFLRALESFIKKERFGVLFDTGKIKGDVLQHAEQDYCWNVGKCVNDFKIPSPSEMQTITGMMHRLIPSHREFQAGFKGLGDTEYFKKH